MIWVIPKNTVLGAVVRGKGKQMVQNVLNVKEVAQDFKSVFAKKNPYQRGKNNMTNWQELPINEEFNLEEAIRKTNTLVLQVCSEDKVSEIVKRALKSGAVDKEELKDNYRLPKIMAYIIGRELQNYFKPGNKYDQWFANNIYGCI